MINFTDFWTRKIIICVCVQKLFTYNRIFTKLYGKNTGFLIFVRKMRESSLEASLIPLPTLSLIHI